MGIAVRTEAGMSYPRMEETLPAHTRMWLLLRHSYYGCPATTYRGVRQHPMCPPMYTSVTEAH